MNGLSPTTLIATEAAGHWVLFTQASFGCGKRGIAGYGLLKVDGA